MKLTVEFWIRIAAWFALTAIVIVTVVPIGLRPTTPYSPNVERFFAMAVVGIFFGAGYPKRFWIIWLAVLSGALIELLQFFSVSRHPALLDAAIKSIGAGVGTVAGRLCNRLLVERSILSTKTRDDEIQKF